MWAYFFHSKLRGTEDVVAANDDLDHLDPQELDIEEEDLDAEDEEEDIISALVPDSDFVATETLPSTVVPIKDRQEFVCSNCHLVKARSQLADPARGLCRD